MFTGAINIIGKVDSLNNNTLNIKADYRPNIGDNIAIDGVCLTVVDVKKDGFCVELSKTTKDGIRVFKDRVHIESALRLKDKIEGHIIQGHIDAIGTIVDIKTIQTSRDFYIKIPNKITQFISPKGSIAVNGVSLTIQKLWDNGFIVSVIPYTLKNTLFSTYKRLQEVNIETDCFARYIWHVINSKDNHISSGKSWDNFDKKLSIF